MSGIASDRTNITRTGITVFQPSFLSNQSFPASQKPASENQHTQPTFGSVAPSNTTNLKPFVCFQVSLGAASTNAPRQEIAKNVFNQEVVAIQQPPVNEPSNAQDADDVYLEDPHFVLGVRPEALEKE